MTELGELEKNHDLFSKRNLRVIVVSIEDFDAAKKTQTDFPHLVVVSDKDRGLSNAVAVIHANSGPERSDTSAPTTMLIDRQGVPQWVFRPADLFSRLSPNELAEAADKHLPSTLPSKETG
jgi:peroxiredoxin